MRGSLGSPVGSGSGRPKGHARRLDAIVSLAFDVGIINEDRVFEGAHLTLKGDSRSAHEVSISRQ